jgi:hypothetical protein
MDYIGILSHLTSGMHPQSNQSCLVRLLWGDFLLQMGCEALIWDALPSKESGGDCGASPTVSSTIGYPGSRKFETQAENGVPPRMKVSWDDDIPN